ncbi:TAXI family TRAP transporter solute-binding subunit [Piscibacillus halophilus]|uniref:TAXI family TRAP transporter solute-binding subunit n=1 Tax=Piscibacillus halophilus TaxID=571933 RepID=UPI00158DE548|nr:TAXI family TRAP transporter solute-binding subunit [Piscibacillus halophilus]
MKKLSIFLAAIFLMFAVLVGCSESDPSEESTGDGEGEEEAVEVDTEVEAADVEAPSEFTFGAATVGGFWYTLGGAMGDTMNDLFPGSSTTVVEGGSVSNLLGLGDGTYHIGFSNGQTVPEALEGKNAFEEPIENVSTLATLYPNVFHIAVRADSDIHTVEDLKGKTVSPGIKGYSGELAFQEVLEFNDMSYDDLDGIEYIGTADAAQLLRDGHIDAIAGMLAAPVSTYQELDTTLGIRLIPLSDETIEQLHARNEGYLPYTIEGGTYENIEEDTQTVAGYTVLLANDDLISEDVAYEITKMMVENRDAWENISSVMSDFDAEFSVENNIGNLHPGAERYYKEVGVLE